MNTKNSERNESITFSMKGFLQKMAYTIQTIVLFGGLAIMGYNKQITSATKVINDGTKSGIGIICFRKYSAYSYFDFAYCIFKEIQASR